MEKKCLKIMTRARTIHYCNACDYKTDRKYDRDKHVTRMHGFNVQQNESQKIIQEPIQINDASYNEPLHNIQYGSGSTVIPIEKYNQAVESSHLWKNNCEKLEEDNYVKDNAVKIRDVHLQNQNIKLQDEIIKNNNLHADYHNALEKIENLELINKEICNQSDDKIAAMGKDMGKVIRENKHLKRIFFKRRNRALDNYNRWKNMQYGDGVKKKFLKIKSPTILQKDRDVTLAPSTISVFNNGKVQYRGEKTIQDGIGFFSTAQYYNVILEFINCKNYVLYILNKWK